MSKFVAIGELIIDFQSKGLSTLKDTSEFVKKPGGAPANVCVQVAKNGHHCQYISKVGADAFGEFLIDTLNNEHVDTKYISCTADYDTSLAFVSLKSNGERDFCFFRKAAADLHLDYKDFAELSIEKNDIVEFGSVALKTVEARQAHDYLIDKALTSGALVCFDPNVRLNLWDNHQQLQEVIKLYAQKAHIIKIGDDELSFITNCDEEAKGIKSLFQGNIIAILLTRGSKGATLYLKNDKVLNHQGYKVKAIDTTGAGDSFFGGFITKLLDDKVNQDNFLTNDNLFDYLDFASKCGAYTTTSYGAISALGSRIDVESIGK